MELGDEYDDQEHGDGDEQSKGEARIVPLRVVLEVPEQNPDDPDDDRDPGRQSDVEGVVGDVTSVASGNDACAECQDDEDHDVDERLDVFGKSRRACAPVGVGDPRHFRWVPDEPLDVDDDLDQPDEEEEDSANGSWNVLGAQDEDQLDEKDGEAEGVADPETEANDGAGCRRGVGYKGVEEEVREEDGEEKGVPQPEGRSLAHQRGAADLDVDVELNADYGQNSDAGENDEGDHPVVVSHGAVVGDRGKGGTCWGG